jgi:phosphoadenosine phosphosulfate reductase
MTLNAQDDAESESVTAALTDAGDGQTFVSDLRRVGELTERYIGHDAGELLRSLIEREFAGRLAVVSSFGPESAVILAQIADIDRDTPVLFLDTGKLFSETLRYRDRLVAQLGLRDVRTISPDSNRLAAADPQSMLWLSDPDSCCALRKVEPLKSALAGFDAWLSGRKRYHGGAPCAHPGFDHVI